MILLVNVSNNRVDQCWLWYKQYFWNVYVDVISQLYIGQKDEFRWQVYINVLILTVLVLVV